MTVVSGETGNVGTGEGNAGDETPDLSSGRRGEWVKISPGCSLEGMMLKLKLQYFGHLT